MRMTSYFRSLVKSGTLDSSKSFALLLSVIIGAIIWFSGVLLSYLGRRDQRVHQDKFKRIGSVPIVCRWLHGWWRDKQGIWRKVF